MKHYELTYLIKPELQEEEVKKISEKIISKIQEKGGTLDVSFEQRGPIKRKLAYPVQKNEIAYLASINFSLDQEKLKDVKTIIDNEEQIIRYLIVIKKEAKKEHVPHFKNTSDEKENPKKSKELKNEDSSISEETPEEEVEEITEEETPEEEVEEITEEEVVVEETPEEEEEEVEETPEEEEKIKIKTKVDLDDVDKKLDEILE